MAARKKTSDRRSDRRLVPQQSQSYRSVGQFDDAISAHGWIANPVSRDHGEDVIVDIFDKGISTGLTFKVQLKSTTSLKGGKSR